MAAVLPDKKSPWLLIIIFLVFSLTIAWAGVESYRYQKKQLERETIANLGTVADLKAEELGWWRRERLGDARVLTANPLLARELQNLGKSPHSASARQSIVAWLQNFKETYRYQTVQLLDAQGELLLQTGITSESKCTFCDNLVKELIQYPRIIFSNFYWDAESRAFRCLILAPIFSEGQTSLQGIIVLRIDPYNFLFPMLRTWSKISLSAEIVLALREGDEVIVLHQLQHQTDTTAPTFRLSLDQGDAPAVQAIKGWEGLVKGKDYRRVPVLAVVRNVPDSPWYLVAKVDEQEVFAESEKFALHILSLVGSLVLAVGLGLAAVWRQQYTHYLSQLAELEAAQTKKLNDILSATPDEFYLIDDAGHFLYANQAANQALSLAPGELVGKTIQEGGFPAETGHHLATQTAAVFSSGQSAKGEISLPDTKSPRFYDYILTPLHDKHGSITSVLATLREVTDRRRMEEDLRQTKEFLSSILTHAPMPFFVNHRDSRFLLVNAAWETLADRNQESVLGHSLDELFSPRTVELFFKTNQQVIETGNPVDVEETVRLKGKKYYFQTVKFPLRNAQGEIDAVGGISLDITKRKLVEAELVAKEQFIRNSLDSLPQHLAILDASGNIIFINDAWRRFALENGATGDFLGENYLAVCDRAKGEFADEAPLVAAGIRACLEGAIDNYTIEYPCPSSKEERFFLLRANRFRGEGQIRVAITHIDITERKQAENQVKASLREKEVLLKEIHHRVKNNMQIVSSLLRLQSSRVKNQEVQEVFQESQNRIRSMALVHEMLYRSPDLARIHFSSYLEVLANSLFRSFKARPDQITLRLDLDDFVLPADQALSCGLIITELESNVLKYAFPEGRQGELSLRARQTPDRVIELVVQDNGVGLPPDLDYRTTESLGLRLVMLLVGQLHGAVEVDRMNGTSFIITFKVPNHE